MPWRWALAAIAPFEVELLSLAQFSGRMMVWRELRGERGAPTTFDFLRVLPPPLPLPDERKKEERTAAFFFCNLIASLRNVNRLPAIPLKTRPRLTPSLFWHARRVEPPSRFTRVSNETHVVPPLFSNASHLFCPYFRMQHICFALPFNGF